MDFILNKPQRKIVTTIDGNISISLGGNLVQLLGFFFLRIEYFEEGQKKRIFEVRIRLRDDIVLKKYKATVGPD